MGRIIDHLTGAILNNWKQLSPTRYHHFGLGVAYGITDTGTTRHSNEDNFLIDEALGLVVIGDGMGGHEDGEIASAQAIIAISDFIKQSSMANPDNHGNIEATAPITPTGISLPDPDATWSDETMPAVMTLHDAVEFANECLYTQNCAKLYPEGQGMGTTLTGLWQIFPKGPIAIFHVGDSRLYRYRKGELALLTRDQTLYQQAIEAGTLDNLPASNVLLQAIGPNACVKPDVLLQISRAGDLYLLCTDGLHGSAPHAAIQEILSQANASNLAQMGQQLIALAKEYASKDNITVVLIQCNE